MVGIASDFGQFPAVAASLGRSGSGLLPFCCYPVRIAPTT